MTSGSSNVKSDSFESLNLLKRKSLHSLKPNMSYAVVSTFTRTSYKTLLKKGNTNENSYIDDAFAFTPSCRALIP